MKIIAVIIILIWIILGLLGMATCDSEKGMINWYLLLFLLITPFLAFLKLMI